MTAATGTTTEGTTTAGATAAGATTGVAAVVLAAGAGERLRPLTELRPKPLCPVANRTLLDRALDRLAASGFALASDAVAVNAHHLARQVVDHLEGRGDAAAHVSVETPEALGTAGALGALRDWLDGRDVLVHNGDVYLPSSADPLVLDRLLDGWDHERVRLLVTDDGTRRDFGPYRYVGLCLLPGHLVQRLTASPSGLYEVMWRQEAEQDRLELVVTEGPVIDCAGPGEYLAANLDAVGAGNVVSSEAAVTGEASQSAVGAGARVEGRLERSVVWPGSFVGPEEHLFEAIRAVGTDGRQLTVQAGAA